MDSISIFTEAANQFFHAPAWLLLVAAVIAFGYFVKGIPQIPNRVIPPICALFGTCIMPLIADSAVLSPGQKHPTLVFALMGFVISMLAWACHGIILKRLEKKFGLFQDEPSNNPNPPENQAQPKDK